MNQTVIDERIRQIRSAVKAGEFIAPVNVLFLLEQYDLAQTQLAGVNPKVTEKNTDPNRINILQKRLENLEDLPKILHYDLRSLADCNHLREIAIDVLEEYSDRDNQEQRVALALLDALEFLDFLNTKIVHLQRELKHTMEWIDDEARQ